LGTHFFLVVTSAAEYYGKYLGPLKSYHHGLGGDVYAVGARTLHIRNFVYDGEGPGNHCFILFTVKLTSFHNEFSHNYNRKS